MVEKVKYKAKSKKNKIGQKTKLLENIKKGKNINYNSS